MSRRIIHTPDAPAAIGTYSQAVLTKGILYTSGQVGIDPHTGHMVEGGIKAETFRSLQNIEAILKAAGLTKMNIIKLTVFVTDLRGFSYVNESFETFFGHIDFPARSTVEVSALPLGAKVEIECVATVGE
ncbi:MAG: reactive intermediate/imine deaminase [Candidatus Marinimicrobia bacterium]|jgi:2-iminobutanoate/2-iminopropanoate deaminase|nr:reactive intermediate/imine deaminase [Candidatus Neomarinimicrobiota bacterium]MBT3936047.1 reactive intermediate/imine deaminase [Candidatus Neomarinimicrobiota bacterium]MBT3960458.1 reactive intermediate/imine deaminase [Candidatus Neomarinimicrobiota bacterium]MBT4383744.1 reactive intermediate/imine deaminase [Candidatus Neomarinimicrobiota bacterium]MBT4636230.1 reactive intermediate/imine deaminase [Candidatus Neomarinimicrobiota bacterium]|tara:strand:+ start:235 stop:624 length:390 start_codon:yes stop_codon:yes gene_type:complete